MPGCTTLTRTMRERSVISKLFSQEIATNEHVSSFAAFPVCCILLEGNFIESLDDIYASFGFSHSLSRSRVYSFTEIQQQLVTKHTSRKACACCQGWTVLLELECAMGVDDAACAELSLLYHTRVLSLLADKHTQTYALSLFVADEECRELRVENSVILANHGKSLPGEPSDISLMNEKYLLAVARHLGVDLSALPQCDCFYLDEFSTAMEFYAPLPTNLFPSVDKPWWRFWHAYN